MTKKLESGRLPILKNLLQLIVEEQPMETLLESFLINCNKQFSFAYSSFLFINDKNELIQKSLFNEEKTSRKIAIQYQNLLKDFPSEKTITLQDGDEYSKYNNIFNIPETISLLTVKPIHHQGKIIAFFLYGNLPTEKLAVEEELLIDILPQMFIGTIANKSFIQVLVTRNDELKKVIKQLRHDFANDIQSIALALELLESTAISEEQKKYVKILGKGKNAAIEKLTKLRALKEEHEQEIKLKWDFVSD